jgi:hypothetical protein
LQPQPPPCDRLVRRGEVISFMVGIRCFVKT